MKRTIPITILVILTFLSSMPNAAAQLAIDLFHNNMPRYFAGRGSVTWVGSATMLTINYTDTVHVSWDSTDTSLLVRRKLVNANDTSLVSYGYGLITPEPGDTSFSIKWTEQKYPEATGRIFWDGTQWVAAFDGEWKQWFINLRELGSDSFEAAVARKVGAFPAVELMDVSYRRLR